MTTLSRLAKVIKGYTPPIGWIEKAFASLVSSIKSVLPEYSITDKGKVLGIGQDEGHLVNVSVINLQTVTLNNQARGRLAADSWDFSMLEEDEEVTVMVNNNPLQCVCIGGGLWDKATQEITIVSSSGQVRVPGLTSQDVTISCSIAITEYEPVLEWGEIESLPNVGANDKDKYLHTDASTGALEWESVRETPVVGENDKDKYLHTNASTGELEWAEVSGGGNLLILHKDDNTGALDKTWQEIHDAIGNGTIVVEDVDINSTSQNYVYSVIDQPDMITGVHKYIVRAYSYTDMAVLNYEVDSANGYPAYSE